MYLDANNLYGWAMSQKLLVNGFKWRKTFTSLMKISWKIMMKIPINVDVEVDAEYPKSS